MARTIAYGAGDNSSGSRYVGLAGIDADGRPLVTQVHPEYRRRGIATALKAKVMEYARRRGLETLVTGCLDRNVAMLRVNEKLGFRRVGNEIRLERPIRGRR